jgi:O-antigen ligase
MVRVARRLNAAPGSPRSAAPPGETPAQRLTLRARAIRASAELRRIEWTLPFVGFILYLFIVVTYKLPLTEVALGAALFGMLLSGRIRVPALLVWFAVFVLWAGIGVVQSEYGDVARQAWIERAKLWVVMLIAVNAIRSRAQLRFALLFFLVSFAVFPARATLIMYALGNRVYGRAVGPYTYANPNDLAAVCLLALAIALALFATERKRSITWFGSLASIGTLLMITLMTQSRGAFLGLTVMLTPYVLAKIRKQPKSLIGFALAGILVVAFAPAGVWERVGGLSKITSAGSNNMRGVDEEGSAENRYLILQTAVRIVGDHPATGVGLGTYRLVNYQYAPELGKKDTHNTYLNLAAETGIPGALLFVAMMASLLRFTRRVRREAARVLPDAGQQLRFLELGMIGFLVAGIFGSYSYLNFPYVFMGFLYSCAEQLRTEVRAMHAAAAGVPPQPVRGRRLVPSLQRG